MKRIGLRSGYTALGATRVTRWWMLACLLWGCFAQAQDESRQQALSRAVELHQSGHYAEAITEYQVYLRAHPEAAAVRSNLGAALAHEGRYTEAVQEYPQALAVQPTNYGIRFHRAPAYYKTAE